MKKLLTILTIVLGVCLFTNCEENDEKPAILEINYVGFESRPLIGVDPTASITEEIKIAASNTASSDRTFNIVVNTDLTTANASAYSVPSSATVPANSNVGTFDLGVIGPNINTSGDDILALDFVSQEGLLLGATMQINLKQVCPNPELFVDITFDQYPEEVYWRILDAADNVVSQSMSINGDDPWGAYDGADEGTSTTKAVCLASGTYTFEMYDKFSDGGGPFSLTFSDEVIFSSDGAYGFTTSTTFTIP